MLRDKEVLKSSIISGVIVLLCHCLYLYYLNTRANTNTFVFFYTAMYITAMFIFIRLLVLWCQVGVSKVKRRYSEGYGKAKEKEFLTSSMTAVAILIPATLMAYVVL